MLGSDAPELLNRTVERDAIDGLLSSVRSGRSAALVIRGEPGIGKTALLGYASTRAEGFAIAAASGVQAEMELLFAGLHQLCQRMLDRLDVLPHPHRAALEVALGLAAGSVPDRFLVGLGALGLLAAVAEQQPLLCIVDDAQWLDTASAEALGFAARRMRAESVALLVAIREPTSARGFDGLPELRLQGLGEADARVLLARGLRGPLDERIRDRIVADTHGNPLALLELPRRMTVSELAGGFEVPMRGDLPAHIERHFVQRIAELPDATQQLMLLAAADPLGDPSLVWRAGRRLDLSASALVPAAQAELLEIGVRVRFRHPLVRSAVYGAASVTERRRVHEALAEVSDSEADADLRAWHRSLAAAGPDESIAAELERSAQRAQARGGLAAAAAFLQRAVILTRDRPRRRERALAAAEATLMAGDFDTALGLLVTAEAEVLDDLQRVRVDLLRAQIAFATNRGSDATPLLLEAARRLERLDASLARATYVDAFSAAMFGARLNRDIGVPEVARAARRVADSGSTKVADLLLNALVAITDDYATAVPVCDEALQKLLGESVSAEERLRWLWQGCVIALEVWDDDRAYRLSQHAVEVARATHALPELALALSAHTPILVLCGDLATAEARVAESRSVEEATGIRSAPYGALMLEAWRGRTARAEDLIQRTMRDAALRREGVGIAIAQYARAVSCAAHSRYTDAVAAARATTEHREVVAENWGLSELVEAATRGDQVEVGREALARLTDKARAAGTDWALGIESRSRALLAEGGDAEAAFRNAIDRLARTRVRAELARTHLLYGEWLRRENRRLDARVQLRMAHDQFTSMGMEAFAERVRTELRATGETVRKRTSETRDELTAQEQQVAQLVIEGLSNPQVAARLFLSPRTVEWHLRHIFAKLGIRSRGQLAIALSQSVDEAGAG